MTRELRCLTLSNETVRSLLDIHSDLEIVEVRQRENGSIDFVTRPKEGNEFPKTVEDYLDESTLDYNE